MTYLGALAAIINIIGADQLLGGHDSLPADLVACEDTDAMVTAHMLIKGRAHSPMMQFNYAQAMAMPAFTGMLPHLSMCHITGLANLASDAASRGKLEALHALARQLGVIVVEVEVPQVALDLLHNAVKEIEKLQAQCPYSEPPLDIYRDGDVQRHPGPKVQFLRARGHPLIPAPPGVSSYSPFHQTLLFLQSPASSTKRLH